MSKPPTGGEGEGVSRWKQRQAAKQMMYALSQEGSGDVTARRKLQETQKYEPSIGDWKGKVWGLASSKVINRQDASTTRFSGSGNGEVYYGERRQLSSDLPPEDPPSWLNPSRPKRPGAGGKGGGPGGSGDRAGGSSGGGAGGGLKRTREDLRTRPKGLSSSKSRTGTGEKTSLGQGEAQS